MTNVQLRSRSFFFFFFLEEISHRIEMKSSLLLLQHHTIPHIEISDNRIRDNRTEIDLHGLFATGGARGIRCIVISLLRKLRHICVSHSLSSLPDAYSLDQRADWE